MHKFVILEGHKRVGSITVDGNKVIEGEIPKFLRRGVESVTRGKFRSVTIEKYLLRQVSGMGNMRSLEDGDGMIVDKGKDGNQSDR